MIALIGFCLQPVSSVFGNDKQKWTEYKGTHFIIYYQNAPKDFVESVESSAENYYQEIARNLGFARYKGWTWDERAKIYIYDDQESYVAAAKFYSWSHGGASPKNREIHTFPAAHGFFDSTLPHELGHIIFREFVGFKAEVPLWFEEGVAMYQEKAKRWGANAMVKKALADGTFIPLDELTRMRLSSKTPPEIVNLYYAEAASVVYYLITQQGESRFVNFCRKLQEGKPFTWTLASVYIRFKNIDALNKAWMDYLKNE